MQSWGSVGYNHGDSTNTRNLNSSPQQWCLCLGLSTDVWNAAWGAGDLMKAKVKAFMKSEKYNDGEIGEAVDQILYPWKAKVSLSAGGSVSSATGSAQPSTGTWNDKRIMTLV